MMGWANCVYFISGIVLGMGGSVLVLKLRRRNPQQHSSSPGRQSSRAAYRDRCQQLELAWQMAADMARFKQGFLGRIAHELRSPLNGTIGMHQLILNDLCDSPEEERQFVSNAHDSALKLMKLIDEMIVVSKAQQGTDVMEIETIALREVFQGVYDLIHLQAANRNLKLQIIMPEPDIYVQADLRRLRQVLTSLIDSAISHMREGEICLQADPTVREDRVYLYLEDERSPEYWQEPLDLMTLPPTQDFDWDGKAPPGLSLIANQSLLELMQGNLELLERPMMDEPELPSRTRLQITLPAGRDNDAIESD
ncbi:sensor histidine kinase [Roseofilum casamattae]|uniref:histidine kinase n=1 Tax=Roseofilum casamattae BLCC-M143 TaxID=3022442 RepID=A0ABT7BVF4_9CYAN|nr:sensor histidine kinase [Roseofilum casamattae]MDJ1183080.1 sensor histidine kinase [Roseofilum casamattae BLCC-M143]